MGGICCAYGSGSYSVKVNDEEVASGGEFSGSTEEKQFDVDNMSEPPTTPPPITASPTTVSPTPAPSSDPTLSPTPTPYPTHMAPTMYPIQDRLTTSPTTAATDGGACGIKGEACQVAADCCSNKCRRNKKICRG